MNEITKTSIYVGVAVAAVGIAVLFQPAAIEVPRQELGDQVFDDFTDATTAERLLIAKYNEDENNIQRLEIANEGGIWSVASHKSYPADAKDAKDRIRDVALNLQEMSILNIASEVKGDHRQFGVVEPTNKNLQESSEGIGLLISVADQDGKDLAQLIVGKKVRDSEGQRFVRVPQLDAVYVVKLDVEKLSTEFEDWIEDDLLDLNKYDIETITLKDYNVDERIELTKTGLIARQQYEPRLEVTLKKNSSEPNWELTELLQYRRNRPVRSTLLDDEELDTSRLDDLADALDDLKIVDVISKPKQLSSILKEAKGLKLDAEAAKSLKSHGFYLAQLNQDDRFDLLSSDGEVRLRTKDAVEYILRFGKVAGVQGSKKETTLNRYILVSARVDQAALAPPKKTETLDKPPTAPEAAKDGDDAKDSGEKTGQEAGNGEIFVAAEADNSEDAEQNKSESKEDAQKDKEKEDDVETDEQKQLREKREKAEQRVKTLNDRFADWYYVISEDVYKKIHLSRFDIIKEKDKGFGVGELRDLKKEGLKKEGDFGSDVNP